MNRRRPNIKEKECFFCIEKKEPDFLESEILSRFISERGRLQARIRTGICSKHQREFTKQVKRARFLALLPFVVRPE